MIQISHYKSPIGDLLIAVKNDKLIGLWIENQKYYLHKINEEIKENNENKIIKITKIWLDKYFNKEHPNTNELKINLIGTEFQKLVWNILRTIPYGKTITYKEIANKIVSQKNIKHMSSQAVGNAVSHNPISIIIPCHRVIGTNGSLTGYAAGLNTKIELLKIEGHDINKFN